jgi:hypothetical protein
MHNTCQSPKQEAVWEDFLPRVQPPNGDKLNGSILNVASVIKNVVALAAESEVGACLQNAQTAAPL